MPPETEKPGAMAGLLGKKTRPQIRSGQADVMLVTLFGGSEMLAVDPPLRIAGVVVRRFRLIEQEDR